MNHSKRPWIYLGIIIVLLILFFIFFNPFANKDNNTHTQHNSSSENNTTSENDTAAKDKTASENTSDTTEELLSAYLKEQDAIMSDMMRNMSIDSSGNAAIDFLKGMIPHHQSAIDMANSYLTYGGTNPELKQLAENIINAQTAEIDEMNQLIAQIEASGDTNEDMERDYLEAYQDMMSSHHHMSHGTSSVTDVEQAFAEGMIMHHQMAVDMAKDILNYTDHQEVRSLAENIIELQEQEIADMKKALGE